MIEFKVAKLHDDQSLIGKASTGNTKCQIKHLISRLIRIGIVILRQRSVSIEWMIQILSGDDL